MALCGVMGLLRKSLFLASWTVPCRTPGGDIHINYDVNGIHWGRAAVLSTGTSEKVKPTQRVRQHSAAHKPQGPVAKV